MREGKEEAVFLRAETPSRAPVHPDTPIRISWWWALLVIGGVVYGSLLPLEIRPDAITQNNAFGLKNIAFHPAPLEDLVTNVAVYFPVGLLLSLSIFAGFTRPSLRIACAVVAGCALSISVEAIQTAIPQRVASWIDVVLNVLGAGCGAIIGTALAEHGRGLRSRWRRWSDGRPFMALATVLTIGLFVYELAPFDFVTHTDELHGMFRRAIWHPLQLNALDAGRLSAGGLASELAMAAWFVILGYAYSLGALETSSRRGMALAVAIVHCLILAGVIELAQLFTHSHILMTTTIALRGLAAAFGAWAAAFALDPLSEGAWRTRPRAALPSGVVVLLAGFQASMLLWPYVGTGLGSSVFPTEILAWRPPFEDLWLATMPRAAAAALSALVVYGTFALLMGIALGRKYARAGWALAAISATSLAMIVEIARAVAERTAFDPTTVMLASISGVAVARAYPALRSAWTSVVVVETGHVGQHG